MIGLIDYGAGNLLSVHNALKSLGVEPKIVRSEADLDGVTKLILPGVGSFGDCVENLTAQGLWEPLKSWLTSGKPYFGICLGYQILFASSEESPGVAGLGIFPGTVVRFPAEPGLKVPHMGWNTVAFAQSDCPLWQGLDSGCYFYFVHSFFPVPNDPNLAAGTTDYAGKFTCAIAHGAILAVQFHPERSQRTGLVVLQNFVNAVV